MASPEMAPTQKSREEWKIVVEEPNRKSFKVIRTIDVLNQQCAAQLCKKNDDISQVPLEVLRA